MKMLLTQFPVRLTLMWSLLPITPSAADAQVGTTVIATYSEVSAAAFTSDGLFLVTGQFDGTMKYWDLSTGGLARTTSTGLRKAEVLSFDARFAYGPTSGSPSNFVDDTLLVWSLDEGRAVNGVVGGAPQAVSPDGTLSVAGHEQLRSLSVLGDWIVLARLRPSSTPTAVRLSPDNRYVAVANSNSQVELWDVAAAKMVRVATLPELSIPNARVGALEFSPDGKSFIAAIQGQGIGPFFLFDTATGEFIQEFTMREGEADAVTSLAFSHDGRWIISGHETGLVVAWTRHHSMCGLHGLPTGHGYAATGVSLSPDGRHAFAHNSRGNGVLWDITKCLVESTFGMGLRATRLNSGLFRPKGEFETTTQYDTRMAEAARYDDALFSKYATELDPYLDSIDSEYQTLIQNYIGSAVFRISAIGEYDADREMFPVTIVVQDTMRMRWSTWETDGASTAPLPAYVWPGVTEMVRVPLEEAPAFKAQYQSAGVSGLRRPSLHAGGGVFEYYNIRIAHPSRPSKYSFGRQEVP